MLIRWHPSAYKSSKRTSQAKIRRRARELTSAIGMGKILRRSRNEDKAKLAEADAQKVRLVGSHPSSSQGLTQEKLAGRSKCFGFVSR